MDTGVFQPCPRHIGTHGHRMTELYLLFNNCNRKQTSKEPTTRKLQTRVGGIASGVVHKENVSVVQPIIMKNFKHTEQCNEPLCT